MSFHPAIRWIAVFVAGLSLLPAAPVRAQSTPASIDWRAALTCPPAQRQFADVLYCTGADETGAPVYVVVVDMTTHGLAFEYVLPEGVNQFSATPTECRDPNVPAWGGPAGGCAVPGKPNEYPRLTLTAAVQRAREVRTEPELAAVITADYAAPDATHGPEGLMVVRGERLDGAQRCDDDFNGVLRPWLGLGSAIGANGMIPAQIGTLDDDTAAMPAWMYTGIGGGPWLVHDGQVDNQAAACIGARTISNPPDVTNCSRPNSKSSQARTESYGGGSCRDAPHTAAGLSQDGRWLFLTMSTSAAHPDVLARFLAGKLGVWQALKFDGGGSAHLWFGGSAPQAVDAGRENRPLTNHLALYAEPGAGITLPLDGQASEPFYYQIMGAGERAQFRFSVRNTGALSWLPEDDIALREISSLVFSGGGEKLPLPGLVAPGDTATWDWQAPAGAITLRTFQLFQAEHPLGQPFGVLAVEMPAGMEDQRRDLEAAIQEQIDAWRQQGEQQLSDFQHQLEQAVQQWLQEQADNALQEAQGWLQTQLANCCAGIGLPLGMVLTASRLRRRRSRQPDRQHEVDEAGNGKTTPGESARMPLWVKPENTTHAHLS